MKFRVGKKCIINKGTLGEIKGVLSKAPYKIHGEWFVEVTHLAEDTRKDGTYYTRRFTVRAPKDRVTMK